MLLVVSLVMVDYCQGQVTFSRGWTPGKRGSEGGLMEHHVAMKTATQLYRMLIVSLIDVNTLLLSRFKNSKNVCRIDLQSFINYALLPVNSVHC